MSETINHFEQESETKYEDRQQITREESRIYGRTAVRMVIFLDKPEPVQDIIQETDDFLGNVPVRRLNILH